VSNSNTIEWLSAAITQATKSAEFCVSGSLPAVDPGLHVEGLGPVTLPLKPRMAKSLIARCQIAPYGQGTKTLVDRDVRNTYELNPEQFWLSDAWEAAITDVVRSVAETFGLPPDRLEARLYKLLVYERGGFFLPHRDSEKHNRMVASMIVVLSNEFGGGELLVRHKSNEQELEFEDAATGKGHCYAAFYADCEHEVQRVTRGRRICLAYNLVLKPQRTKSSSKDVPSTQVDSLVESIRTWVGAQPARPLVFALEHHYTQRGLSLDLLKGGDQQLADLAVRAAEQAGCLVHLAQVERRLLQFADDGSFERGYRRSYREYSRPRREITIGETYEDHLSGDQWTDLQGNKQPWGAIAFDPKTIVSSIPLDDWTPTSEEFEGYTGNAGNTLDRWYHRSALVLWHRDHHFDVIASSGTNHSIPLFCEMATRLAKTPKQRLKEVRDDCIRFARAIINRWPDRGYWYHFSETEGTSSGDHFAESLLHLHDRDTIAAFLSTLAKRDQALRLDNLVLAASHEFGWNAFDQELKQLISTRSSDSGRDEIPFRDVRWLSAFCRDETSNADKSALANELCSLAVKRFCEAREPRRRFDSRYRREKSTLEATLPLLVKALIATGRDEDLSLLLGFVQQHPEAFRLSKCQVPALKVLIPWAKKRFGAVPPELASWLASVRQTLESLTAEEPLPPTDWVRPAKVDCQCQYCAQLNAFLSDSAEKVGRISAREECRRHLIMKINDHRCDVTHTLEKGRSPYTLVLTKTSGSFNRALKRFHANQKLLEELPPSME
jgi:hypothetical protein